jgi:integrase/recombinase XerD
MNLEADFASLCESFFTKRLIGQRKASPHTVAAYAHTFRLLTRFAQDRLRQLPSKLSLAQLDAPFLTAFLEDLETTRENDARSRNARLAALRSFYRYVGGLGGSTACCPNPKGVIDTVQADRPPHG